MVQAKLATIRQLLDDLEPHREITAEELITDRQRRHIVERVLTLLVDTAAAANSHIAASLLREPPHDYADSFTLASRCGAIEEELATELVLSAGLRNVLVHEYADVDVDIVAKAVGVARKRYAEYADQVARWLTDLADEDDPASGNSS